MATYNWQQGLKGAGGGALAGGALGGPAGALIGGGLGLLGGFGGGESEQEKAQRQMLMDYYSQLGGRQAPQLGQAGQSAYSGFRQNQAGLISRLEAMASGQGPSLARQQFEQATDRNMRAQQAQAASGRGGPLSQLTAANNMAMLGANAAQGSALARTNEQMQAIGALGGVISQGRGADEATNMFNTGQGNQFQLANLNARLQQMGMNDQARLQILSQLGGQNQAQAMRPGLGDQILAGGAGMYGLYAGQQAQRRASQGGGTGGVGQMAAGIPLNSTMNPFGGYGGFNYDYSMLGQPS